MRSPHLFPCAAILLLYAAPGRAQEPSCADGDAECLLSVAVLEEVGNFSKQRGLPEFVIGTVCSDPQLAATGRAKYASALPQIIAAARTRAVARMSAIPYGTAQPLQARIPVLVRTARSGQAAGTIAGLESMFGMYPRTRAEYCARMKLGVGG